MIKLSYYSLYIYTLSLWYYTTKLISANSVTLGENKDTDSNKDSKDDSKDESDAEDSQDQGDGEDQSTDSLLQDFENQKSDGTAYEQFFGFLN